MKKPFSLVFPVIIIWALTAGLIAQFVWKMIYFPEPVIPFICELVMFVILAVWASYLLLGRER